MSISLRQKEFVEHIVDLSQVIGPVYSKRMFGGHGIFLDGIMFGLVFRDTFYLKVDKDKSEGGDILFTLDGAGYPNDGKKFDIKKVNVCLLYTSPSPRDS